MTRERFNHLLNLVDEVNSKMTANASLEHSANEDYLHISLFYAGVSRSFNTYPIGCNNYHMTAGDTDLIKGEAFMRLLLASAEHCEVMRT